MTRAAHVVVVGGGLAGLTAAITLGDAGVRVTLLERAPRLGGATWSFSRDGLTFDNGQHVFMRCCTEYLAFLHRIGSGGKVTLQARMDVPVRRPGGPTSRLRRTALPAPLHLARSLATYRHLTPAGRARTVRTALALRRLRLDDPALDSQTFARWLIEHGAHDDEVAALWDLVCLPTVNLRAADASLLLAAKVFQTGLLETAGGGDLGWANVPLQQLHGDAAARALAGLGAEVRLGERVTAVRSAAGGATVAVDGASLGADAVIVAVPHDAVGTLLPDGSFPQQVRLRDLGRSPIINVHLLYDRRVMDEPFLAGLHSPVQFVFDRTGSSGAPPGHQLLAISLSAADDHLPRSRAELVARFTAAMRDLLPGAGEATVVAAMVTREVAATFRGAPGSAGIRPGPDTSLPGVYLAGAWTDTGWPATMEGAVRSGLAAADAVRRHLVARRPSTTGAAA